MVCDINFVQTSCPITVKTWANFSWTLSSNQLLFPARKEVSFEMWPLRTLLFVLIMGCGRFLASGRWLIFFRPNFFNKSFKSHSYNTGIKLEIQCRFSSQDIVLKLTLKYVLSSGQKFRKCIEITDSCHRWKTVMQYNQCW